MSARTWEKTGIFRHCWWDYKVVQPLTVWQLLQSYPEGRHMTQPPLAGTDPGELKAPVCIRT